MSNERQRRGDEVTVASVQISGVLPTSRDKYFLYADSVLTIESDEEIRAFCSKKTSDTFPQRCSAQPGPPKSLAACLNRDCNWEAGFSC